MIVQIILAMRMGTRELESDDEDEEKSKEAIKEEVKSSPSKKESGDACQSEIKPEAPENVQENNESTQNLAESVKPEKQEEEKKDDIVTPQEDHAASKEEATKSENIEAQEPKTVSSSESKCEEKESSSVAPEKSSSPQKSSSPSKVEEKKSPAKKTPKTIEVEEFLVKFKNFSYLHCQWLTEEELYRGDKRIASKIKRYKQKRERSANLMEFCEEEPFNPDYVEVDRVLDCSEHTDDVTGNKTKHFLVKWRSLPYEDCTWELESDVDPVKIKDFERWKDSPPDEVDYKRRGRKHEWKKMDESPEYKNGNKLRPYQLEGVNWLLFSWFNGRNCLLADEMGLGKTIQSICFLDGVFRFGIKGPFLVIAPLSTIPNWQREFELWTDMNVIVYHGSQTSRNMLAEYEMYYKNQKGERRSDVFKFHVLITTYECVIADILELREISWRVCVIDEAHRLKNQKCKLLEGLNLLEIESRLLLSGTPLQNNINELYSLLSFLEPAQFSSQEAFVQEFGDMQNEDQVNKLQALLKPLMLRRMKEDVEKSLKPKEETIVEVELTNIQKKYYR
jgi:chromodomain-helicase-DNA-binding protein 7